MHHTRPHTRLFRGRGLDSGRAMESMETVAVHGSNKIPRAPSWHGPVGAFVRNTVLEELALQWGHVSLLHLGIGGIAWTYSGVLLGPFRYGLMGGFCWKTIGGECCYPGRKPTTINFAGLWSKQYTVAVRCAWSAWTSRVTQLGPRLPLVLTRSLRGAFRLGRAALPRPGAGLWSEEASWHSNGRLAPHVQYHDSADLQVNPHAAGRRWSASTTVLWILLAHIAVGSWYDPAGHCRPLRYDVDISPCRSCSGPKSRGHRVALRKPWSLKGMLMIFLLQFQHTLSAMADARVRAPRDP